MKHTRKKRETYTTGQRATSNWNLLKSTGIYTNKSGKLAQLVYDYQRRNRSCPVGLWLSEEKHAAQKWTKTHGRALDFQPFYWNKKNSPQLNTFSFREQKWIHLSLIHWLVWPIETFFARKWDRINDTVSAGNESGLMVRFEWIFFFLHIIQRVWEGQKIPF